MSTEVLAGFLIIHELGVPAGYEQFGTVQRTFAFIRDNLIFMPDLLKIPRPKNSVSEVVNLHSAGNGLLKKSASFLVTLKMHFAFARSCSC